LRGLLSDDELSRAGRFAFARDRDRFIVAHARLRQILAAYLGARPTEIRFGHGPAGKPYLAAPVGHRPLGFNLSHSGDLALYAVAWDRRVGIDVEDARRERAFRDIAKSVFSARERAELAALPDERRRERFYTIWTRKEAFIKALGEGMSYPLDRFSVVGRVGEPALELPDGADAAGRWALFDLSPGDDYAAALAVDGGAARLQCFG
jgi:4'-phosphopantetheinyl transferase